MCCGQVATAAVTYLELLPCVGDELPIYPISDHPQGSPRLLLSRVLQLHPAAHILLVDRRPLLLVTIDIVSCRMHTHVWFSTRPTVAPSSHIDAHGLQHLVWHRDIVEHIKQRRMRRLKRGNSTAASFRLTLALSARFQLSGLA